MKIFKKIMGSIAYILLITMITLIIIQLGNLYYDNTHGNVNIAIDKKDKFNIICIDNHRYYERNNFAFIKLDDNGKPIKCKEVKK